MTPNIWILWVFLTLQGASAPASQAAAFTDEESCLKAKASIETAHIDGFRYGHRFLICTPNYQVRNGN